MARQDRTALDESADHDLVVAAARQIVAASDSQSTAVALRPPAQVLRRNTPHQAAIEQWRSDIITNRAARRVPYLATAATAAAGYAGWGAVELATLGAGTGGEILAATGIGLTSITATTGLRALFRARIPDRWRRQSWLTAIGTASWVTTAAAVSPTNWAMTALLAGGAAAGWAGWMRAHEVPVPDNDQAQLPAAEEHDDNFGDTLARRWAENIAGRGGVIPGAMLTDRVDLARAIRWTVQTRPGSAAFNELFPKSGRIAAGLRIPAKNLLLEPSDRDESWATLTVIVKDLLSGGISYTGARYDNGRIPLGPFADGEGEMEYIAFDEVGCRNGLVTGEPGSGKSACLEAIGLGLKKSGVWTLWFGDGDPEGGSSPVLNEISNWAEAGPQQVLAQLEAIEAALDIRSLLKSTLTEGHDGTPIPITDPATQRPVRKLVPSLATPGLQWIIDELHRLTSDPWLIQQGFVPRLERVVRIGRKYGVVVLTGTQSLLAPDYGNSTTLRGYLAARNVLAFRNQNRSETAVVSGLSIAPSTLPAGGGYCFATTAGRLSMGRVAWANDLGEYAADLPTTDLDADTELATAEFRPAVPRDPSAVFAEQAQRLTSWRSAKRDGASVPAADPPLGGPTPSTPDLGEFTVPSALTAENVITLRPARKTATAQNTNSAANDRGAPDIEALPAPQQAVYEALTTGTERTGEIALETGLRSPAVSKALTALADLGLARKIAHGQWALATAKTG